MPFARVHRPLPTLVVDERTPGDHQLQAMLRVPDARVNEAESAALHDREGFGVVAIPSHYPPQWTRRSEVNKGGLVERQDGAGRGFVAPPGSSLRVTFSSGARSSTGLQRRERP
jgi:hypothetical protein